VDAVAIAEDVRLHLRIPAVRLVAEMRASVEQRCMETVGTAMIFLLPG
jgi:hypothetical protein